MQKYKNKLNQFEFELKNWYPFGDDFFRIDHNDNYFSFFKNIGKITYSICLYKNRIIGTACGILRNIYLNSNLRQKQKVWYICDLKISKFFRGKFIPFKIFSKYLHKLKFSNKIYLITMIKKNEKINKVYKMIKNFKFFDFEKTKLLIYVLDYQQISLILSILRKYKGNIYFVNNKKYKDLRLKSNNSSIKLLHMKNDLNKINDNEIVNKEIYLNPVPGYKHMFCLTKRDYFLIKELNNLKITTDIKSFIIHHNMKNTDWSFISTDQI